MTRRLSVALALVTLASCPPVARADSLLVPADGPILSGPALAGDQVAWASHGPSGSVTVLTGGAGGVRTIAAIPPPRPVAGDGADGAIVAASADRVVAAETATFSQFHITAVVRQQVLTGAVSGPLDAIAGCGTGAQPQCGDLEGCGEIGSSYTVDVSGPAVAYANRCGDDPLTVIDYGSNPPARQTLGRVWAVRIAGRYLAWLMQSSPTGFVDMLVVYDRSQGREAYRLSLPNRTLPLPSDFDVQDDGKVAVAVRQADPSQGARLAWASPAEPSLHYLPVTGTGLSVHIASDRIAVSAHPIRHLYRDLSVYDLGGTRLTGTRVERADGDFDFDGARLSFATRPCETSFLTTWDLASAAPPAPPSGRCPVPSLEAKTLRPDATGFVGVPLRCPATPALGCAGRLHLVASGRRGRAHGRRDLGDASYTFPSGGRAVVRFKLNDTSSRFLRRYRKLTVTATAIGASRAEQSLAGDFLVGQSKFELRRR